LRDALAGEGRSGLLHGAGRGQPIEHTRCECEYAEGYVGVDGRAIRPIPGEEALDRASHEPLSKDLGLPAEPPPG
jgi:hypothetical protein